MNKFNEALNLVYEEHMKAAKRHYVSPKEYNNLTMYLNECDNHYHNYGTVLIPDELYDDLRNRIVSNTVGGKDAGYVKHVNHIYSIRSFYETDNERILDELNKYDGAYLEGCIIDRKIDGVPVELVYRNGNLKRVVTRGDGEHGLDVTPVFLRFVTGYPTYVDDKEPFEVVGEVALPRQMGKDDCYITYFDHSEYVSRRNMVAGILLSDDYDSTKISEKAEFVPYDFYHKDQLDNWHENLNVLFTSKYDFKHSELTMSILSTGNPSILHRRLNEYLKAVICSRYDCDGIVVKIPSFAIRSIIGYTAKFPKYQFAIKHKPAEADTHIKKVVWNRGFRTNRLCPVFVIAPVTIDNKIINKINAHNLTLIKNFKVNIGDKVKIKLPGSTAPQLSKYNGRCGAVGEHIIPKQCPRCGAEVEHGFPHLICTKNCK